MLDGNVYSVELDVVELGKERPRMLLFFRQVYSANYNGGDIKEVLTAAVHNVQNLAVDWLNFKLYILEAMVERIDVCDFSGANRITLVAENLQSPHGLALDPTVGCVYIPWFHKYISCYKKLSQV